MIGGKEFRPYGIGDMSYPLSSKLMTPFEESPLSEEQSNYNYWLSSAHARIEQGIGQLRCGWQVLRQESNLSNVFTVADTICSSVILHNYRKIMDDPLPNEWTEEDRPTTVAIGRGEAGCSNLYLRQTCCHRRIVQSCHFLIPPCFAGKRSHSSTTSGGR